MQLIQAGSFTILFSIGIQELIHEIKLDIENYDIEYEWFFQKISHGRTDVKLITIALKVHEIVTLP